EGADPRREEYQPEIIDPIRFYLEPRVLDETEGESQGQHADRDIDVEDPRPTEGVRDVAAERRAQGRAHHHTDPEDRHRAAVLVARELLIQDRLRGGQQRPAP